MMRYILLFTAFACLASEPVFKRSVDENFFQPAKREKVFNKTLIYAERQPYLPYQNFLHHWIDRPLFTDISLRTAKNPQKTGFLYDVNIAKNYGLDGFASISYYGLHLDHLKYLKESGERVYNQMLVVCPGDGEKYYQQLKNHINTVTASPYTANYHGKPFFWMYGAMNKQVPLVERLRADIGNHFWIFAGVPFLPLYEAFHKYDMQGEKIPEKIIQDFRKNTQAALTLCGGLQLRVGEFYSDPKGAYGYRYGKTELYRKYMLPIILDLMKQEQNKGKLLGTYITHGYVNHMNGTLQQEYGTHQLRTALNEAALMNPDVLVLFEWNEANENTSFQPTVSNGRAIERIINYYKQCLNSVPLEPRPGDNVNIPNLVLSSRQMIRIGEVLHYELLHIPDNDQKDVYQAQLILKDQDGNIRLTLPVESFHKNKLYAVHYEIPSEKLSDAYAVYPEVKVTYNGMKQTFQAFDSTILHSSICKNYKYTRQPLREQPELRKSDIKLIAKDDNLHQISIDAEASEPIASLEILISGKEVFSYDVKNEFDQKQYANFRGIFSTLFPAYTLTGDMTVKNSKDWKIRSGNAAWEGFKDGLRFGNTLKLNTAFTEARTMFFLSVPRKDMDQAVFSLDYERLGHHEFNLGEINRLGKYAKIFPNYVRLDLERMDDLPDYPVKTGKKSISIQTDLRSSCKNPLFQLRVITDSGKIFRGKPVMPQKKNHMMEDVILYSEFSKKAESARLQADRIPDLKYDFTPNYGALLKNSYEPCWDIMLGGGWYYAQPAWTSQKKFMPENFKSVAPAWEHENGIPVLKFDGAGSYMILPVEAIPRSANFRIQFEIKTDSIQNQVLLRTGAAGYYGSLQLFIENGKLKGQYFGTGMAAKIFHTDLSVPLNQWCRISIEKSFDSITFAVNDKAQSFPYHGRGLYCHYHTFGGDLSPCKGLPEDIKTFSGLLRSFRISHLKWGKE